MTSAFCSEFESISLRLPFQKISGIHLSSIVVANIMEALYVFTGQSINEKFSLKSMVIQSSQIYLKYSWKSSLVQKLLSGRLSDLRPFA